MPSPAAPCGPTVSGEQAYITVDDNHEQGGFGGAAEPVGTRMTFRCAFNASQKPEGLPS
jgi:hypothetical protein